jgi:hypothetical protein
MTIKAPDQAERTYNFGDVAVHGDGSRVVVTELPDDPDFAAVNVGVIEVEGINLVLRPSGSVPISELRKEPGGRWSVEMVTDCVVRAEFGRGANEDVRACFREVFERHAERPGVPVPQR